MKENIERENVSLDLGVIMGENDGDWKRGTYDGRKCEWHMKMLLEEGIYWEIQ